MPHISSEKLDPQLSEKIFGKLLTLLGQAQNKDSLSLVVNELFTHTEKIMLAKRIAVILLLENEVPQHKITMLLKVSPTTVAKASLRIEMGKCDAILKVSRREKADIEKIVWKILTVGGLMPPKAGQKNWRKNLS